MFAPVRAGGASASHYQNDGLRIQFITHTPSTEVRALVAGCWIPVAQLQKRAAALPSRLTSGAVATDWSGLSALLYNMSWSGVYGGKAWWRKGFAMPKK